MSYWGAFASTTCMGVFWALTISGTRDGAALGQLLGVTMTVIQTAYFFYMAAYHEGQLAAQKEQKKNNATLRKR